MRVALTVLNDAFRLLRARKLFWVSIWISVLAAVLYLSTGFDEKGITFLFGAFDFEWSFAKKGSHGAELFYLGAFRKFIVGVWLTWVATILALIAYAPVFPEFIDDGSAGVTLSKPVSRPLLFLYKFLGGLLFLAVQVTVFVVIVFMAIRWRLGWWSPGVLWAIPLVLLVFSYLLSVMVWLGIKTRSVMASLLLTLLFWFFCSIIQGFEAMTYGVVRSGRGITGKAMDEESSGTWERFHEMAETTYAIVPKPGGTLALLDRWIVLGDGSSLGKSEIEAMANGGRVQGMDEETLKDDIERHSPFFIIGSSLAFELVVLGLGMRAFCRRDF